MSFKDWIKKIKKEYDTQKKSEDKAAQKEKASGDKGYPNRFVKFYHLNKDKLVQERKSTYAEHKKSGLCVRCRRKALPGIVFCEYHQGKQKEYNQKARGGQ
jgi:aromatic ring hydroxylase